MTNILKAIYHIILHKNFDIKNIYLNRIHINSIGNAFEEYIKDAFANTFDIKDEIKRRQIFEKEFSWLGNQNNLPDIMIKGGDAIEVKKTQSPSPQLALNSSYPKCNLSASSKMITQACKLCEDWDVKDLIYCIGHTTDTKVKSLWMVYGSIYAAKHEIYQQIYKAISDGVETIANIQFSKTKELGRVNQVDPLGITNLRIRGMWQIKNPRIVFNYLHEATKSDFELVCIIPERKYNSFPISDRQKIEQLKSNNSGFTLTKSLVKNPNNPAKLINCVIIKFCI